VEVPQARNRPTLDSPTHPGKDLNHPHHEEPSGQLAATIARQFARDTEARRALAPEALSALTETGLLRAGLPEDLGGPELPPGTILRSAEAIARGDASAGWCVSIAATSSLLAAYLPPEGGQEVFGRPDVVAMPKAELQVLDTWHTAGLRGTGSHDTTADEVFVPHHRVLSVLDGPLHDGALYRFPIFGFFALSIAAAALGNARGAVDDLTALAVEKRALGSSKSLAERTQTQAVVAQAEAALRAARLLVYDAVDQAWRDPRTGRPRKPACAWPRRTPPGPPPRSSPSCTTWPPRRPSTTVSPLQRRFRDAHTATAHFQVNQASYELAGRLLLGLPTRTEQL
jgi:alkylation response protein AidB-like acyl-CoA dehydrogenase